MSEKAPMDHVKTVIADNDIVFGIWQDASESNGVGVLVIKGNRELQAVLIRSISSLSVSGKAGRSDRWRIKRGLRCWSPGPQGKVCPTPMQSAAARALARRSRRIRLKGRMGRIHRRCLDHQLPLGQVRPLQA